MPRQGEPDADDLLAVAAGSGGRSCSGLDLVDCFSGCAES
jgi:hypothetical protein